MLVKDICQLEGIRSEFLWHTEEAIKKFHVVNREQLCQSFENGGIGFQFLTEMNQALLAKWLWKYGEEPTGLWRKVIQAKYKDNGRGWCTKKPVGSYGSGLWKDIFKEAEEFSQWCSFQVGRGDKVLFCHDIWCGSSSFAQALPDVYSIALLKTSLVVDHIVRQNGHIAWDLHRRRPAND